MSILAIVIGTLIILSVLWETFESIILPRSVVRKYRLTQLFYIYFWKSFVIFRPREGEACFANPTSALSVRSLS